MRGTLLLALCGCGFSEVLAPADLSGADFAGADFSIARADLAGADLAGADLSPVDLQAAFPCALPILYVTVEDTSGGGVTGRIARLALGDGSTVPDLCSMLSAQGLMTSQPQSLAAVGDKLAVVGLDELQLLDPMTDTVVWSKPLGTDDFPVDVFSLTHPNGNKLAGAAYGTTHESPPFAIARVDAWALDGTLVKSWLTNGADLPLGLGIYGISSSPDAPTHFVALDPNNSTFGWEVDPWGATKSVRFGSGAGSPITIYGDIENTQVRFVWVDSTSPTAVYYNNQAEGGSIFGPIRCMGCTLLHAVPDPTDNLRFYGLCDGPTVDSRRVVRFDTSGGTCDTILEGAAFGADSRLSRLSISQ